MLFSSLLVSLLGLVSAAPINLEPRANLANLESRGTGYTAPHRGIYKLTPDGFPADLAGFNRLFISFLETGGAKDAAAMWQALNPADRSARLDAYHKQGVAVIIAAFGANNNPTGQDAATVARDMANWVNTYGLDGIDVDYEDTQALVAGNGVDWVVTFTKTLRQLLGPDKIISHAPQFPYFLPKYANAYDKVHAQVGDMIDFYNIQYYNNPADGSQDCAGSLLSGPGSISDLISRGYPAGKLVLGKPLTVPDANDGYMAPQDLAACLAQKPGNWPDSYMFWQWHDGAAQQMMGALTGSTPPVNPPVTVNPNPPVTTAPAPVTTPSTNTQTYDDGMWHPEGKGTTGTDTAPPFWLTGRWKRNSS